MASLFKARKPETLFFGNVSWAFRTAIAAALAFLLVPSPQTIFVLPFFCAVISIACCQKTIGNTLIVGWETFVGAVLGGSLGSLFAYILLQQTELTYRIALPFILFCCVLLLSHPVAPAKPFAFTLLFLGLGVPLTTKKWYFGFSLLGTTVIGLIASLVANALPLPHPRTGYRQTTALLQEAESLTQSLLIQMANVTATNDTHETVAIVRGCRHLNTIIAELESLREATRLEMKLCCYRRESSEYERRLRLLLSQVVWLDGMRQAVEQRQGEPIYPDQKRFIDKCLPSYLALLGAVGDTMVRQAEPINTQKILSLLHETLTKFLQARTEVFYKPMFENGKAVLPVLIHSLRRSTFVFHMSRLAEGIAQGEITKREAGGKFKFKFNYRHPIKMALCLVIGSLWFVVPDLQASRMGKGIWIGITICFLSSSDFGSSVTKSLDRLQGSLLACAFSIITIRMVGGSMIPAAVLMCVWVFVTSFFRGGREHGYAALVAAFTAPVLLFGGVQFIGTDAIESFILARVEMTAIGVAVYLAVQALIWPVDPVHELEAETAKWFELAANFAKSIPLLEDGEDGTLTAVSKDTSREPSRSHSSSSHTSHHHIHHPSSSHTAHTMSPHHPHAASPHPHVISHPQVTNGDVQDKTTPPDNTTHHNDHPTSPHQNTETPQGSNDKHNDDKQQQQQQPNKDQNEHPTPNHQQHHDHGKDDAANCNDKEACAVALKAEGGADRQEGFMLQPHHSHPSHSSSSRHHHHSHKGENTKMLHSLSKSSSAEKEDDHVITVTHQETEHLNPPSPPASASIDFDALDKSRQLCVSSLTKAQGTVYAAAASPMPHRRPFAHVAYLNLLAKQQRCVVHMAQICAAIRHLGRGQSPEDHRVLLVVNECALMLAEQLAVTAALMMTIKHSAGWNATASDDVVKTSVALRQFGLLQGKVVHLWGDFLHDAYLRRNPQLHLEHLSCLEPDHFQKLRELNLTAVAHDHKATDNIDCSKSHIFDTNAGFIARSLSSRLRSQQRLIASSAVIAGMSELCATLAKAGADIEAIYF